MPHISKAQLMSNKHRELLRQLDDLNFRLVNKNIDLGSLKSNESILVECQACKMIQLKPISSIRDAKGCKFQPCKPDGLTTYQSIFSYIQKFVKLNYDEKVWSTLKVTVCHKTPEDEAKYNIYETALNYKTKITVEIEGEKHTDSIGYFKHRLSPSKGNKKLSPNLELRQSQKNRSKSLTIDDYEKIAEDGSKNLRIKVKSEFKVNKVSRNKYVHINPKTGRRCGKEFKLAYLTLLNFEDSFRCDKCYDIDHEKFLRLLKNDGLKYISGGKKMSEMVKTECLECGTQQEYKTYLVKTQNYRKCDNLNCSNGFDLEEAAIMEEFHGSVKQDFFDAVILRLDTNLGFEDFTKRYPKIAYKCKSSPSVIDKLRKILNYKGRKFTPSDKELKNVISELTKNNVTTKAIVSNYIKNSPEIPNEFIQYINTKLSDKERFKLGLNITDTKVTHYEEIKSLDDVIKHINSKGYTSKSQITGTFHERIGDLGLNDKVYEHLGTSPPSRYEDFDDGELLKAAVDMYEKCDRNYSEFSKKTTDTIIKVLKERNLYDDFLNIIQHDMLPNYTNLSDEEIINLCIERKYKSLSDVHISGNTKLYDQIHLRDLVDIITRRCGWEAIEGNDRTFYKSLPECLVADFMLVCNIPYKKQVPFPFKSSANGTYTMDFQIKSLNSQEIAVEVWGLHPSINRSFFTSSLDSKPYLHNRKEKTKGCKDYNIPLIELEAEIFHGHLKGRGRGYDGYISHMIEQFSLYFEITESVKVIRDKMVNSRKKAGLEPHSNANCGKFE